ncbi:MAG: tetratricopeptide repeat protein [Myxococcales bacterium]|nr:tetratricopeptide repeat protein [Myxococcales bacterium]
MTRRAALRHVGIQQHNSGNFGACQRMCIARILWAALALALSAGCNGHGSAARKPKLSETHRLLAVDLLKKKNPDGAIEELVKALKYNPDNRKAHLTMGQVLFLQGVHAMNFVERTQCLKGQAAADQRNTANERFRRAADHLRKSLTESDDTEKKTARSNTLNYLANIALHFKRYDEAIELSNKALNNILYAARFHSLGTRGWAYFKKGNLDKAASDLRQALFHQPRFCVGRYRLAKVYYAKKQYPQAIAELTKVVNDKACTFQDPHHLLGLAYSKTKQSEQARAHFDKCVALNPRSCVGAECRRYAKLIGQAP